MTTPAVRSLALLLVVAAASACGSTTPVENAPPTSVAVAGSPTAPTPAPKPATAPKPQPRERPAVKAAPSCPRAANALGGVYHPDRLIVLAPCKTASGTVSGVRSEEDGDLHIRLSLDPRYRGMLNAANVAQQHGDLVVEFMARDGGHLPEPYVGEHVVLTGAWVLDTQHGWRELHPVFAMRADGRRWTSGPRFGGSPQDARSRDAAERCRTPTGRTCKGYGYVSSGAATGPPDEPTVTTAGGSGSSACEPGYSPCLPRVADLNCADIAAALKPIRVTGSDPYRLDGNHDGWGCTS